MRAYSQDLRDRVLGALERGERPTEIARRFEVSRMWVYQVRRRFEREGSRESLRQGGDRISRVAPLKEVIQRWIAAEVDVTLAELSERRAGRGVPLTVSGIWHPLDKWGWRFNPKFPSPLSNFSLIGKVLPWNWVSGF
ncbi:MAG: helix-turn-helix domain-containing protein [Zoogloeaceae bacterium]|jgi:transposase|nr:helix-turn-helix domain-containing protein [Zoogloeaceae bacterium]